MELNEQFDLDNALRWGTLPKIYEYTTDDDKLRFLRAYAQTYLKEEIWYEHFIRKLDPFRRFLEVAAQCNTKIINMSNIARDVGADAKTIREYFSLLECIKLASYFYPEYRFSYLKTKDDVEVDLVVERPGLLHLFIEIKSAIHIDRDDIRSFMAIATDFKQCEAVCFSRDPVRKHYDHVVAMPWCDGLKKYFMP